MRVSKRKLPQPQQLPQKFLLVWFLLEEESRPASKGLLSSSSSDSHHAPLVICNRIKPTATQPFFIWLCCEYFKRAQRLPNRSPPSCPCLDHCVTFWDRSHTQVQAKQKKSCYGTLLQKKKKKACFSGTLLLFLFCLGGEAIAAYTTRTKLVVFMK